jgi:hypothetical protein
MPSLEESKPSLDERRLLLEENRLRYENSFARKWFPTLAIIAVPLTTFIFSAFQYLDSRLQAQREKRQAASEKDREWRYKTVDFYFSRRNDFDLVKNPQQASRNLQVLSIFAPAEVARILSVEQNRVNIEQQVNAESVSAQSKQAINDISSTLLNQDGRRAVINDPDGYTNIRSSPRSDGKNIIGIVKSGQEFKAYPEAGAEWWRVSVPSQSKNSPSIIGFMHRSRITILK